MNSKSKNKTGPEKPVAFYTPAELERVKRELGLSRAEVAAAREAEEKAEIQKIKSRHRRKVILRVAAVVILCAAVVKMVYVATPAPQPVAQEISTPKDENSVGVAAAATSPLPATTQAANVDRAMNRLNDALHSFPDKDENEVVREVNRRYPSESMACRMAWKDGTPAISLGGKGGDAPTIATALNGCARAIEKFHSESAQQPH